jgi:hypothetical protein
MKKILKWIGIILGSLLVIAFFGFLYFIPPFTIAPPDAFSGPEGAAPPSLDAMKDPAKRAIAEKGKYIVTSTGCTNCHTPQGDKGPKWDEYLAGGNRLSEPHAGTVVSRNLTSDPQTGLARRSDAEVMRVLRSGVLTDGRQVSEILMPWGAFSNLTQEDRYAVVTYLRNLHPVKHTIPEPLPTPLLSDPKAYHGFAPGDFAEH